MQTIDEYFEKHFENETTKSLESTAIQFCTASSEPREAEVLPYHKDILINQLGGRGIPAYALFLRNKRLNQNFKFTPKTLTHFIQINDALTAYLDKEFHQLNPTIQKIKTRLKKEDSTLKSAFISLRLDIATGSMEAFDKSTSQSSGEIKSIGILLNKILDILEIGIKAKITASPKRETFEQKFRKKREHNWNNVGILANYKELSNHYINFVISDLCNYTPWALSDILKIKEFYAHITIEEIHPYQKINPPTRPTQKTKKSPKPKN